MNEQDKAQIVKYLETIANLKGMEYVNRAICFASTFVPSESCGFYEILATLALVSDRKEIRELLEKQQK